MLDADWEYSEKGDPASVRSTAAMEQAGWLRGGRWAAEIRIRGDSCCAHSNWAVAARGQIKIRIRKGTSDQGCRWISWIGPPELDLYAYFRTSSGSKRRVVDAVQRSRDRRVAKDEPNTSKYEGRPRSTEPWVPGLHLAYITKLWARNDEGVSASRFQPQRGVGSMFCAWNDRVKT